MTTAKVILDSVAPSGARLTTIEVRMHRFVLAELNTHRAFSRNSASSRAIPVRKQLEQVLDDPALPVEWRAEQSGMQGGEELTPEQQERARVEWLHARDAAVASARRQQALGVHKSVTNRLLEPFMWHKVIITATDWDGFWAQRCSPLAQPEIRVAAEAMQEAYDASTPTELDFNEWHTPYIQPEEDAELFAAGIASGMNPAGERVLAETRKRVSVARCARVSYLTHDGKRDIQKDLELYDRLATAEPPHWSPFEHVATPCRLAQDVDGRGIMSTRHASKQHFGNFTGWDQLRHLLGGR